MGHLEPEIAFYVLLMHMIVFDCEQDVMNFKYPLVVENVCSHSYFQEAAIASTC